jgi:hypothetical protein
MMPQAYRSPFTTWIDKAAVRSMPMAHWMSTGAGQWFPADEWSVAAHPDVVASGRGELVVAGLLLGYLDFTIELESSCVGPASRSVALARVGARYDDEVARDALRLQCDEAFHALLCQELRQHVHAQTGLNPVRITEHRFIRHARELRERLAPAVPAELVDFCAAVVAETVITKTLLKDWNDQALRPEVREFLLQHYKDELRHSAFYGQVLGQVWPQWDEALRHALAPHWSALTLAFVEPDPQLALAALALAGFADREAWRITAECQARAVAALDQRASVEATLRALRKAGVAELRAHEVTVA